MIPQNQLRERNGVTYIDRAYVEFLLANDLVVDASEGGLISGPGMAQGGILLIGWNKSGEVFISGQVGGWQFLVNAFAEFDNRAVINGLATYQPLGEQLFMPYQVPSHINVFNVVPRHVEGRMMTPVLFYCTSQICVLPRVAAKANLSFLDTLNRAAWLKHYTEKQPAGTMRETAFIAQFNSGISDN